MSATQNQIWPELILIQIFSTADGEEKISQRPILTMGPKAMSPKAPSSPASSQERFFTEAVVTKKAIASSTIDTQDSDLSETGARI